MVPFPGYDGGQVYGRGPCSPLIPMEPGLCMGSGHADSPSPHPCPAVLLSPTLCCRHPSCWSGCCPGGSCRAASRAGWLEASGALASWQGEPAHARASTAGQARPVGTGAREAGQNPRPGSRVVCYLYRLTCQRAHPRLRASAAMHHRTLQGCGCLSTGRASRVSAVARSLGSGSSIMMRTDRSSEDRPVHRVGLCQG